MKTSSATHIRSVCSSKTRRLTPSPRLRSDQRTQGSSTQKHLNGLTATADSRTPSLWCGPSADRALRAVFGKLQRIRLLSCFFAFSICECFRCLFGRQESSRTELFLCQHLRVTRSRLARRRRVPAKNAAFYSGWGRIGSESAGWAREVPSSYRDYFGNLGFFCAIIRDITPIAARQPLGWNSAVSGLVFWLGFLRLD